MNPLLNRLALVGLCLSASVGAASADTFLIAPGRSIGQTELGPNGAAELKRLPTPDAEDAAMQQINLVWATHTPRADTLFIHGINNAPFEHIKPVDGITINEIRVTSPQFHTRNGISTASTLAQVRRRFPDARPVSDAPCLYDDTRHGIAFEFALPITPASRCIGISVIKPLPGGSGDAATPQSTVNGLLKNSRVR